MWLSESNTLCTAHRHGHITCSICLKTPVTWTIQQLLSEITGRLITCSTFGGQINLFTRHQMTIGEIEYFCLHFLFLICGVGKFILFQDLGLSCCNKSVWRLLVMEVSVKNSSGRINNFNRTYEVNDDLHTGQNKIPAQRIILSDGLSLPRRQCRWQLFRTSILHNNYLGIPVVWRWQKMHKLQFWELLSKFSSVMFCLMLWLQDIFIASL